MTPTLEQEWVMACVSQERIRQDEQWGEAHDPGDGAMLAVLVEEVGAVATELQAPSDSRRLRAELVQVAAVAIKWAEAIERRSGCD